MDRTYSLEDLVAAIKRRRMLFAIVAASVFAIAAVIIAALPNEYRSSAVVQIEPHRVAPEYIPAA